MRVTIDSKNIARDLPIIEALEQGRTIQFWEGEAWRDYVGNDASIDFSVSRGRRIKPEPQFRPWKMEEVPVGALLRNPNFLITPQVILGCDSYGVQICWGFNRDAQGGKTACQMLLEKGYEHSLDSGATWKVCGVAL